MNPPVASPDLIEPAGPIDPDVSVVAVQSSDGRPLALLANYSLHYVGGVGPNHVSADYFGDFASRVETLLQAERFDPPFVAMMTNGTSGDINNVNFREPRPGARPTNRSVTWPPTWRRKLPAWRRRPRTTIAPRSTRGRPN